MRNGKSDMVTAYPKDLPLVIFRDLHVLDADKLLVGKPNIRSYFVFWGFRFMFVAVHFLAVSAMY
jgi:hypothetical protein